MLTLNNLPKVVGRAKRVGRGISAGQGKTAGRGTKGQKARRGIPAGFEGGQTRLSMRLPKLRGGRFLARPIVGVVTLGRLDQAYKAGERVTLKSLKAKRLIPNGAKSAKVVAKGTLSKTLKFAGIRFSASVHAHIKGQGTTQTAAGTK